MHIGKNVRTQYNKLYCVNIKRAHKKKCKYGVKLCCHISVCMYNLHIYESYVD